LFPDPFRKIEKGSGNTYYIVLSKGIQSVTQSRVNVNTCSGNMCEAVARDWRVLHSATASNIVAAWKEIVELKAVGVVGR